MVSTTITLPEIGDVPDSARLSRHRWRGQTGQLRFSESAISVNPFGPVGYEGFSVAVARIKPSVHAVYITNEGSRSVSAINPAHTVVSTVTVGPNPVDTAVTPNANGATAYMSPSLPKGLAPM
jgi:YVTN family beta-propeller protein